MNRVYNFPKFLTWAQKSTSWLEFFELIIIGLVLGAVVSIFEEMVDNLTWYNSLLQGLGMGFLISISVFLWWKFLRWWWSIKWIIIIVSITSFGLSLIIYLTLYSLVWLITYLNNKFILIHFYTGEDNLRFTKYDPFKSAFSKKDIVSK